MIFEHCDRKCSWFSISWYFFFWPLCCLFFFDLRILVSSNSSSSHSLSTYWKPRTLSITMFKNHLLWQLLQENYHWNAWIWKSRHILKILNSFDTRRVNLVTNPVISHEWGKDKEVLTTSGTYSWSFVSINLTKLWLRLNHEEPLVQ
jgi:hypothetical protein